jgi:hypothetical protein
VTGSMTAIHRGSVEEVAAQYGSNVWAGEAERGITGRKLVIVELVDRAHLNDAIEILRRSYEAAVKT